MIPVPHLKTVENGPLSQIETHILQHHAVIEPWFREAWLKTPAPLTSSVDLRNAGFKLSPVDTNLFPAGYNNLNLECMPLCIQAMQSTIGSFCQRILIIPENHTRNTFYFQSLAVLREIFLNAGYEVRFGHLQSAEKLEISISEDEILILEPLQRKGSRIGVHDFDPCLVVLNNDLSNGIPEILQNLDQRIEPATQLGWSSRLKSTHFAYYEEIVNEFAPLIRLQPWMLNPAFSKVEDVDFMAQKGLERLRDAAEELLKNIQSRYQEFNILEKPYVVIKADNGTYGMSVMMIHDANEIIHLNRKQRTKMSKTKGSQTVHQVMIQEGIYSFEKMEDGSVAEPVVYMIGPYVVGGFYRVHKELGNNDILNTPGMYFEPLAFAKPCNMPKHSKLNEDHRFYAYGVMSRLAALAAAREAAALKTI